MDETKKKTFWVDENTLKTGTAMTTSSDHMDLEFLSSF